MNMGSEWLRVDQRTQQFHNDAMAADAEHLRVKYDAMPRRSRQAKVLIAIGTILLVAVLGVLIAL